MKCPRCGNSLWFVKDVCSFCKSALGPPPRAASKAPQPLDLSAEADPVPPDGGDLVTLVKCATLGEADAIRTQLEASDITSFLPDEALMQTIAWNVNAYGFIRVQVGSQDYQAAQEVLACMSEDSAADGPEAGVKMAALPLSWPMRGLAFTMPLLLCPGLLMFVVAKGGYSSRGCDRKATELWHWFAGGVVFWLMAFVVFVCLRGLMG